MNTLAHYNSNISKLAKEKQILKRIPKQHTNSVGMLPKFDSTGGMNDNALRLSITTPELTNDSTPSIQTPMRHFKLN